MAIGGIGANTGPLSVKGTNVATSDPTDSSSSAANSIPTGLVLSVPPTSQMVASMPPAPPLPPPKPLVHTQFSVITGPPQGDA